METHAPKAVFLSYASEDAEAARRIAEALRAFGVEVWFDQSELRGGDAWDQKIRRQIKECALFVPVVSANTQARTEGYFRLEWRLADQRTHFMAKGRAFVLPVVIDGTRDEDAHVPESFTEVQWTQLPRGETPTVFCAWAAKLIGVPSASQSPVAAHADPVRATVVGQNSIAVLPFENWSADTENAFFTDGVHEDILTRLSNIRELRVVSRTSVKQYRATRKPIQQIGAELGVAYVVEGSVQRQAGKVRVTSQLIDARSDSHIWAKSYDRDLTAADVFAIQSELAQAIAGSLQATLSPQEKSLLDCRPTDSIAAYDLYLKARVGYTSTSARHEADESALLSAVKVDPKFARAWAQLGALHANMILGEIDASSARLEKARVAIETAVRLAPNDPVVIELYGDYYYYGHRDFTRAIMQYQRLLALRPNSPEAFGALGLIYRRQGRWGETVESLSRALELDPHNTKYRIVLAAYNYSQHRYSEAEAIARRGYELWPDDPLYQNFHVTIPFLATGSTVDGAAWFARVALRSEESFCYWRKAWARISGDFANAILLHEIQPYLDGRGPRWYEDFLAATDWLGQGDQSAASRRLEKLLPELKAQSGFQPANPSVWFCLGMSLGVLGDEQGARACARKIADLLPESADAVEGPDQSRRRAALLAWAGEKDLALAELARLFRTPYGANVHVARVAPDWIPLRGDPRFEALLNDPKNNAPLF